MVSAGAGAAADYLVSRHHQDSSWSQVLAVWVETHQYANITEL